MNKNWYVYFLRCADNSLYCGVTTDVKRRLLEHNQCNKRSAKYTRVRRPVVLSYVEACESRQSACQREYQLKQFSKAKKEHLVAHFDSKIASTFCD